MRTLIAGLVALIATAVANAAPITPAVQYTTTSTLTDSRPFTLGYSFTTSTPLTINALGYWVDGLSNNHQVGLWTSTGTLLASTTVLSGDLTQDNFRWHSIAPLALAPGSYVIGGEFLGNGNPFPFNATGITTISGYTYGNDLQIFGSGLNFPTVGPVGYGPNGILAANFSVSTATPEPISLVVFGGLIVGGAGVAIRRRMTTKAAA